MERVVEEPGAPNYNWFDLDAGKSISAAGLFPDDVKDEVVEDWMHKSGVDVGANFEKRMLVSRGGELIALPVQAALWDSANSKAVLDLLAQARTEGTVGVLRADGALPATFAFQTRKGGRGILQITGFTENPRGVKIRYKLVQNAVTAAVRVGIPIATKRNTVNPIIERVLEGDEAIDFDSNHFVKSLPTELSENGMPIVPGGIIQNVVAAFDLMQKEGLDIFYCGQEGFFTSDMKLKELNAADWDKLGAAELNNRIQTSLDPKSTLTRLKLGSTGNAVYGFRTSTGGIGLLQITGVTENPRGVKIRYKLVQTEKK